VKKNRTVPFVAAITVGMATMLGCAEDTPKDDAADQATVVWWGYAPDTSVGELWAAEFMKDHPDIKVEYTNYENVDYAPAMEAAMQSGRGPDVFPVATGGVTGRELLGPYGMDLASIAEEELGPLWKDQFGPGYVDQLTYDGAIVALPVGGVATGFFWINKDLFDTHGVSTELATYDDLKAACETFGAAGVTCLTMGVASLDCFIIDLMHTISQSYDHDYFLEAVLGERSFDDPTFVAILDKLREMLADGVFAQNVVSIKQYPEANNEFLSGQAAMVHMGTWYAQYAKRDGMIASMEAAGVSNPTPFTMMPMASPDFAGDGHPAKPFGDVDYGMAINKDTKNLEAAKTFVLWLTSTKTGQQTVVNAIDLLPALTGVQPEWDNLGLVDPEIQIPAFTELFDEGANPDGWRLMAITSETNNALVVAAQRALSEPGASTAEIAKQAESEVFRTDF
jgi:ABC-type glycerol-3-phosphate transport system substrate-binding protein